MLKLSLSLVLSSAVGLGLALEPAPEPAASQARLTLERGDTICLLGNATAERMQNHGWLETLLQSRFPDKQLSVRNLGFGGDALTVHQRTMNFGKFSDDPRDMDIRNNRFVPWDRYLSHCKADVVFAFFGFNESFAGPAGIPDFEDNLASFIDHVREQKYNGKSSPKLVLFSSLPHEDLKDRNLPDGREANARIAPYNASMAKVAKAKGVTFVDTFTPMLARYRAARSPLTINGVHLAEAGNKALAEVIGRAVFDVGFAGLDAGWLEKTREAILDKNTMWARRYRVTDGYNVYGGRSKIEYPRRPMPNVTPISNFKVMQREMDILDRMTGNRDKVIWALANKNNVEVDDSNLPPELDVPTNIPGPNPDGSHNYISGEAGIEHMKLAPGMKANLFADERQFPELVNPVQMSWDTKGRLWVAVWPNYPHWKPSDNRDDKLLILEDTDGDGKADVCKTFADDLVNPTGFEFWNGGVLLAACPDLVFLKDTDGDDKYDTKEHLLHGISSADSHHSANSFVIGQGGALYFQEGTFHMSQIESIYGPVRNHNACVWRFDPRTWRVERYIPFNFANPHGHVFDRWGQDFMTDGTGNNNYYSLPFSGYIKHPDKHRRYFTFYRQRSRPCPGTEILSSRHFPPANMGTYLDANVIGFLGIFQYKLTDDGSGFGAVEIDPIVQSDDPNFRPSDMEVGPDGALYFLDWHNAIIGHLQHHIRDPNRDRKHGRVYRVTYEGRPLLTPKKIDGEPIAKLLDLLKEPEDRVRYRARIELSERDTDEVVAATEKWVASLDPDHADYEHHLMEALWLYQQHDRTNRGLLERMLRAKDYRARAAATRVLRYTRHLVPEALAMMKVQANDPHPRVRLEAVVGASFFDNAQAATVALEALKHPRDKFIDYAMSETIRALEDRWKEALRSGESIAEGNAAGVEYLLGSVSAAELVNLPKIPTVLQAMLMRNGIAKEVRIEAANALARKNNTTPTREVLHALRAVDRSGGGMTGHVVHQLGDLLMAAIGTADAPDRAVFVELATKMKSPMARHMGFAGLVAIDKSVEAAWQLGASSVDNLQAMLGGVGMIHDAGLRGELYERVRPIMFSLPAELDDSDGGRTLSGLSVSYYQPPPQNAELATFKRHDPRQTVTASTFTLDIPTVARADAFGMMFTGQIRIKKAGVYRFFTTSDDGSRLYIGDRCIVNNDGAHGMSEKGGRIRLQPGYYPITVTYYDQGGAEGLVVSWNGPGFKKQRIPANVLGSDGSRSLRSLAIQAMAAIPGNAAQKFQDTARLMADGGFLAQAIGLARSVPKNEWPRDQVGPLVQTIAAYVGGLPGESQTAPDVVAALELGKQLTTAMPAAEATALKKQLDGLGGSVILVRTIPHKMLYDVQSFWVEAGKPVAIVFQNNDLMPHNFVITKEGKLEKVGMASAKITGSATEAERNFIPETGDVLWNTPLMFPGKSARLTFIAPEEPGEYPFVCTFPGHWQVMNGVMYVVEQFESEIHVVRRPTEAAAPMREFVKNWKLEDLDAAFQSGWDDNRKLDRGKNLFTTIGCMSCHTFDGSASKGGPDLAKIGEKYKGKELLRQILEPSASILENYESYYFELADKTTVAGRVIREDGQAVYVAENLQVLDNLTRVEKSKIRARSKMDTSSMPTGQLVTLGRAEILDLLAWLQSKK